jgi:hypothetical protein
MLVGWVLAYAGGPGATGPNVVTGFNQSVGAPNWEYSAFKNLRLKELAEKVRDADNGDKDFARKQSQQLIEALSLPCELTDEARAGTGKTQVDGKTRDLNVYEVACRQGTGYFLVSQPPQKPLAISCFEADAMRAADAAKGENSDSDFHCLLPANTDVKAMAASLLTGTGTTTCDVRNFQWLGVSAPRQMEYSEVACADGKGYVLKVPQSGLTAQISSEGCQEAVSEGVKCKLTAVTMPVTLQTFRDAIKEHAVNCEPAQLRYVGRESSGRRYVVELQCPQQPHGLVAFIPLQGNTKPFETLDCPAAVARAVQCQLTAKE